LQHLRFARGQRLLGFRAGVAAFACFPLRVPQAF
jgi:hypothetical protein